mmetsp:Transcript_11392/g.16820  ORF Transcript_11392/g.16820 Transcript_11392/m.16820 type:complete len:126 (-) Transcript_11392:1517-1894(-)|eukprot:CAMPEP_0202439532 /NCGR_PEP_ID=MMETSP1345-20130828/36211_1 /ASSEMBLY_ACC=CAM_ASM_000843 /TAXON_ID=342563 /ORGANISM="Fabrea Fabrea salina" /LENGTH=125 /DNA_ID=CAMNT_0049054067 /DNA_START=874 /DNA_END=1251 /DNA_ORIENTATION=+
MREIKLESPEELENYLEEHKAEPVLALFTGSKDPQTGVSWCDDCERAEPFIKAAFDKLQERTVLICEVGPREAWKNNPDNPYRKHPKTKVKGVPTLVRYENAREMIRLEEARLTNQSILDEVVVS